MKVAFNFIKAILANCQVTQEVKVLNLAQRLLFALYYVWVFWVKSQKYQSKLSKLDFQCAIQNIITLKATYVQVVMTLEGKGLYLVWLPKYVSVMFFSFWSLWALWMHLVNMNTVTHDNNPHRCAHLPFLLFNFLYFLSKNSAMA